MGILLNQQHETFSQEIAKGTGVAKAYVVAGYPPNKGNAYRLRLRKGVAARIAELTAARSEMAAREALTAAERAGVDQYWVLRNLRLNAIMSMRHGDRAAAARSIELIGKHLGMFIEKKSIDISYIDDADEYLAKIMAIVEAKTVEHEPAPLAIGYDRAGGQRALRAGAAAVSTSVSARRKRFYRYLEGRLRRSILLPILGSVSA
jgi:phage terminase small subunit